MDMRLHGSWRRTGLLGNLGIVLAFYVSHTKDASALLGQGIYGGIYLASHLGVLHALMRIGKGDSICSTRISPICLTASTRC